MWRAERRLQSGRVAIEDYGDAIRLNLPPLYMGYAYHNRGIAYAEFGQYERAIEDFDWAIRLDPQYASAYHNRGVAYYHLGQYDLAIEDYDKAIKLDPHLAEAYYGRGLAYAILGNSREAELDYAKAEALGYKP